MSVDGVVVSADPSGGIITGPNREHRTTLSVRDKGFLYAEGKELCIFAHPPPQPFGCKTYKPPFDKDERNTTQDVLNSRSPSDHVFTLFPRMRQEGSKASDGASAYLETKGNPTTSLVVTEVLQAGNLRGAQVVLCDVKTNPESRTPTAYWNNMGYQNHPKQVVAKIFDPLLYPKDVEIAPWIRIDTVSAADEECAKEAAAYMQFHDKMHDPMVRDFVPRFYGAWITFIQNEGWGSSTTRPSQDENIRRLRPVRMVLMEYIDASCLGRVTRPEHDHNLGNFLNTSNLVLDGHDHSLELFSRIIRGLVALKFHGVRPGSFDAHNFLIAEPDDGYQPPPELQQLGKYRVFMINHTSTDVARYTLVETNVAEILAQPAHPVCEEFGPRRMNCLAGMFPLEWRDDFKLFYDWALKTFRSEDFTSEEDAEERFQEHLRKKEEEAKQSDASDKNPRPSEYLSTASESESTRDKLASSADTLHTLATSVDSLRSAHLGQPSALRTGEGIDDSTPTDTVRKGEATAKDAGRKAVEAGITTLREQGGEDEDIPHLADDEQSPEGKTGKKGGKGKTEAQK